MIGIDFSESGITVPECSMYGCIKATADRVPNNIAYSFFGHRATFSEFIKEIDDCARALKALGVGKGDTVTIMLPNCPQAIISIYAVNKIAAIANMVHPLSSEPEIGQFCKISNSKVAIILDSVYSRFKNGTIEAEMKHVIVTSIADGLGAFKAMVYRFRNKAERPTIAEGELHWKDFLSKGSSYEGEVEDAGRAEDDAIIIHTGGTTGNPKGALHSNQAFNVQALQLKARLDVGRTGSILTLMPVFHGFGLGASLHAPLLYGLTCYLMPKYDPDEYCRLLLKHRIQFHAGTPYLFENLLQNRRLRGVKLPFLKGLFVGGDLLTPEMEVKLRTILKSMESPINPTPSYGLSEVVAAASMVPSDGEVGSSGTPMLGNLIQVVSIGTCDEAPLGETGEICVTGPTMMKKYLGVENSSEVMKVHQDGRTWVHTGDLGYVDEHGTLFFVQRLKRMIITNGYNVYPSNIENLFQSHKAVKFCQAIGVPDDKRGQRIMVFIVLNPGFEPTKETEDMLREFARHKIALYSQPSFYRFIDKMPLTKLSKIDTVALQKMVEER